MARDVWVDIGAGRQADFLSELAPTNPDKLLIALDPWFELWSFKTPPNLKPIFWGSDKRWRLPLRERSVDKVFLNLVYAQIGWKNEDEDVLFNSEQKYASLLRDVSLILKKGGIVSITDHQEYMEIISSILNGKKFRIIQSPIPTENKKVSLFTKKAIEWGKTDPRDLPYTLIAQFNQR